MQKQGQSFYTIGSAGHEGNAACALAFRPNDMAFLHYRSAAFVIQRSKQVPGQTPLYDMLLSFAAHQMILILVADKKCWAVRVYLSRLKPVP